jgi:error-prone DNA polymerase
MVIVRQSPPTAKGMVFFTLEDETGFLNLVFTPQVYGHYLKVVDRQSFLCVRGILQKDRGAHSILVKGVYAPLFQKARILALDSGANRSVVSTSLEGNLPSVRQYV